MAVLLLISIGGKEGKLVFGVLCDILFRYPRKRRKLTSRNRIVVELRWLGLFTYGFPFLIIRSLIRAFYDIGLVLQFLVTLGVHYGKLSQYM